VVLLTQLAAQLVDDLSLRLRKNRGRVNPAGYPVEVLKWHAWRLRKWAGPLPRSGGELGDRQHQRKHGVRAAVPIIDDLPHGNFDVAVAHGPHLNGNTGNPKLSGVTQLGPAGSRLPRLIRKGEDEPLGGLNLLDDFLPPAFTAMDLMIKPYRTAHPF